MSSGPNQPGAVVLDYAAPTPRAPVLKTLGWACFLACSWTWCIGMFLPVLLVRDYGVWGWVVFAVPNVVGAAAMGWVIASPAKSLELVRTHSTVCLWFSAVTISFHLFFVSWIIVALWGWKGAILTTLATVLIFGLLTLRNRLELIVAACVLVSSLILFAIYVHDFPSVSWLYIPETAASPALIPLALTSTLGFVLCPYLDLTFQHARQALSVGEAKVAFGLGFGVLFLTMILFTLAYTVGQTIGWLLATHMAVQTAFTIAIHGRQLLQVRHQIAPPAGTAFLLLISAALVAGLVVAFRHEGLLDVSDPSGGELVYRLFMTFYALVFPAYVWLCMIPTRGRERPTKRMLIVFAAAVLLAMPLYGVAFLTDRRMVYALPGLAIVLLARLLIRTGDGQTEKPSSIYSTADSAQ